MWGAFEANPDSYISNIIFVVVGVSWTVYCISPQFCRLEFVDLVVYVQTSCRGQDQRCMWWSSWAWWCCLWLGWPCGCWSSTSSAARTVGMNTVQSATWSEPFTCTTIRKCHQSQTTCTQPCLRRRRLLPLLAGGSHPRTGMVIAVKVKTVGTLSWKDFWDTFLVVCVCVHAHAHKCAHACAYKETWNYVMSSVKPYSVVCILKTSA